MKKYYSVVWLSKGEVELTGQLFVETEEKLSDCVKNVESFLSCNTRTDIESIESISRREYKFMKDHFQKNLPKYWRAFFLPSD